jgi:threonine/homoserine/homoserine lactone efflux protein
VILTQSAELFAFVKTLGAAYLIWLGISSLRALKLNQTIELEKGKANTVAASRSLREGFLSNVLNPKTAVFYLAFLPQFINPEHSPFLQSLLMAAIHFVIAMVWQCGLSGMLNSAKSLLNNGNFVRWMEGTTGAVLIILGIKLLVEEPPMSS